MRYPTRASEFAQPSSYRSCLLHRAIASSSTAGANCPDRPSTAKWLDYEHQSSCAKTGSRTGSSSPSTTSSIIAATPGTNSSINPGRSCPSAYEIGPKGRDQRVLVLGLWLADAHAPGLRATKSRPGSCATRRRGRLADAVHDARVAAPSGWLRRSDRASRRYRL